MKKLLTAAIAACIVGAGVLVFAQSDPTPAKQGQNQPDMSAKCRDMMAQHEKHTAMMKDADAELARLVERMDSADGNSKVDAMGMAVKKLVSHQALMHSVGEPMHMKMMGHMIEHSKTGKGMMDCPMMHSKMK